MPRRPAPPRGPSPADVPGPIVPGTPLYRFVEMVAATMVERADGPRPEGRPGPPRRECRFTAPYRTRPLGHPWGRRRGARCG